jgi:hypothetical protein
MMENRKAAEVPKKDVLTKVTRAPTVKAIAEDDLK